MLLRATARRALAIAALAAAACQRAQPPPPARPEAAARTGTISAAVEDAEERNDWRPRGPSRRFRPPLRDGGAVFFVGNSFMGWEGRSLPEWVAALGQRTSPPVHLEVGADILFGNTPLGEFLHHPAVQAALRSRRYGVFVLQGEEYEPVDHKAAFQQAVRDFDAAVRAVGGQTVLFMTWEFPWRHFLGHLAASYDEIGDELGIPVIPAGLVYRDCDRAPFPGQHPFWLTADAARPGGDLHPNEKGAALDAYAVFEMLTGIDPHGAPIDAPGDSNPDALRAYLSDMAWARVRDRLEPPAGTGG